MNYKLNNIPISHYGATPIRKGEALGIEGLFSLPKRVAPTERDWGTSIEPFVDAEDIKLEGRTLILNVYINGDASSFVSACLACTVLGVDEHSFNVICKDKIEVSEHDGFITVKARFFEPEFLLAPITLIPNNTGNYQIDGFGFNQFGVVVESKTNLYTLPERINVNTTETYTIIEYRNQKTIDIVCSMLGNSTSDLYIKMRQLQAVLMQSGLRELNIVNEVFECYLKDGIDAKNVHEHILKFTLKLVLPTEN